MEERRIRVAAGDVTMTAVLNSSNTADLVWDALPIQAPAQTWGDEIYFSTSIDAQEEDSKDVVNMGDVAYWPPGPGAMPVFRPHAHEQRRRNKTGERSQRGGQARRRRDRSKAGALRLARDDREGIIRY